MYNKEGNVYLKKSIFKNNKYCKYLLFHELTHATTTTRDNQGNEIQSGFINKLNQTGVGFNEAMTEWMTQIRNTKIETDSTNLQSDYRTIVFLIEKLALIIGKEKLINCFLYTPEKLQSLLEENKIDFFQLNKSFDELILKDLDVYNISQKRKLEDISNYLIPTHVDIAYENFNSAIGKINTLEDFYKKYKILNYSEEAPCNPIKTISLKYFNTMGEEIHNLLKNGIPIQEIQQTLKRLEINFNELNETYEFSKCFVSDKNQTAVNIYEFYSKYPHSYYNIAAQSYGPMYKHFMEFAWTPQENSLYNMTLYPIMGHLLKDHSDLDYSEISYYIITEESTQTNLYIFYDSKGTKYMYNEKGTPVIYKQEKDGEGCTTAISEDVNLTITFKNNQPTNYTVRSKGDYELNEFSKKFSLKCKKYVYSEKEELEYHINEGEDTNGELKKILNCITERMKKRTLNFSSDPDI